MFAFRITSSYEEFSKNTEFPDLLNSCDRYVIYQHIPESNPDNIHIHGLMVQPMHLKQGQLVPDDSKRIRARYFAKYYTKKYQLKVCDNEEKYIVYMTKGIYDPSVWYNLPHNKSHGPLYCETYFQYCKSLWVDPHQINLKLHDGKLVRELGKSKLNKRELIDLMMAEYTKTMTVEATVKIIRNILIKNNEVIGLYKVIDYYDSLLMYGNKSEFNALVSSKIYSRVRS